MRIETLSPQPDRAGRYRVTLADGGVLRLYRQTVEDFGLRPGLELTPAQMDELRRQAGQMSAKMRAVRIVSASNVSQQDLENRLLRKGETPEDAARAVEWMASLELIDDRQTARQIVERCARRGYGPARAKQALYEKQIPKELWDAALADYPDQSEGITAFLRARLGEHPDQREIKRAIDALLRRGHSYGAIRQALGQVLTDSDIQEESE